MASSPSIVLFIQAVLVQTVFSQCLGPAPLIGAGLAPALGLDGFGWGAGCAGSVSSTGGSFVVTSSSPVPPIGVTIVSENVYEGALSAGGNLPLLGSVGVEGEFPTAGAGAVSYGCGDGAVAIVAEEGPIVTGIVEPLIAAPYGLAAPFGAGLFSSLGFGYGFGYGRGYGLGLGFGPYGFGYGAGRGCGAFY